MLLSIEENERMTRVGKGTPMGELLRRYWHPIAAASELDDKSTKQVGLLGEDLVLYKDRSGSYGLLTLHCPHRRADLSYGFVEECGLRCSYHAWVFDEKGNCISAPFEDTVTGGNRFRDQIHQAAYPVEEKAGLLFAYMGPAPAPRCPTWESFTWPNGFAQIVLAPLDCNWLQAAENNIDPVHFEWLHSNWSMAQAGKVGYSPTHLSVEIDEWEYGFGYKRILEGGSEADQNWTLPRLHCMPNIFAVGGTHFEYRTPIDDTHTLSVVWAWEPVPVEQQPYVQTRTPYWYAPITDPTTGRWITTHTINQDTVTWVGQGLVSDRENEHLGRSDGGVVMFRNRLRDDLIRVEEGKDPSGLIRDPDANVCIKWPNDRTARLTKAPTNEEKRADLARFNNGLRGENDYFRFYAGQPADVAKAYEEAMGL